jgi:hypothetical protein
MFRLCALLVTIMSFMMHPIFSQEVYTPLTPEEMAAFNQAILNEVEKQDALAADLMKNMRDSNSMSNADMAKLQIITTMVQVKRTLANQLLNTPSMQSPLVREAFLQIMQKPIIEENELVQLQLLIDSEKQKMAQAQAALQEPVQQEDPSLQETPNVEAQPAG